MYMRIYICIYDLGLRTFLDTPVVALLTDDLPIKKGDFQSYLVYWTVSMGKPMI